MEYLDTDDRSLESWEGDATVRRRFPIRNGRGDVSRVVGKVPRVCIAKGRPCYPGIRILVVHVLYLIRCAILFSYSLS